MKWFHVFIRQTMNFHINFQRLCWLKLNFLNSFSSSASATSSVSIHESVERALLVSSENLIYFSFFFVIVTAYTLSCSHILFFHLVEFVTPVLYVCAAYRAPFHSVIVCHPSCLFCVCVCYFYHAYSDDVSWRYEATIIHIFLRWAMNVYLTVYVCVCMCCLCGCYRCLFWHVKHRYCKSISHSIFGAVFYVFNE